MPEMASEQVDFETLLEKLMSPDNNVRTQAEEAYDGIQPQEKITLLLQSMIKQDGRIELRTMAAVLLRRLFTSTFDEYWQEFPVEFQNEIKHQMILCTHQEQNPTIRKKICECTAEFARNMIDDEGNMTWPDILKFMFDGANSGSAQIKESALLIFGIVPGIFGKQQTQYLDVIKQMLAHCLNDQANANVRFAAVKATCAFILVNDTETTVLNHFKDLADKVLLGIEESVQVQEDDSLLKSLIDIAESVPKFLRPQVEKLLQLCIKITADTNIPDQWRQLALEVIVSLAENAPAMVRKFGSKYLSVIVQEILKMMVELEEEDDWSIQDEVEEEDNDCNAIAGESALDRMACALAGKAMLPHILTHVPTMLQSADWKYRHAALMAISACGEGCHKQMEERLEPVVETILPYLCDVHPRVRYAACNAMGQLSTDFGPVFQKKFHAKVVSGLLAVMDDNGNPRVQAHAGAALVNFSEDCPKSILVPYLDMIMGKLDQVLQSKFSLQEKGQKLVLEQVVTTLASVADTAEDRFVNYYESFMPRLKYIVANATTEDLRMLRGKTIECISLIGLAVGREKFLSDSREVMDLLLKTQTDWADLPEDDPQISYMISAWARMCKIMGSEFTPYLQLVMGPILKAAQIKPEVALVDSEDQKVLESDTDWQFVTLGDQQSFGIKTAGLEEKATACQMLVCYARELKEGFAPYVDNVAAIMVAHLKFYFHDGVRVAAAESLPYLLDCAMTRGADSKNHLWETTILPQLLVALDTEPEADIKAEHMHSMAQCIEKMGPGCLSEQHMISLVSIIEKILQSHFEKQATRLEKRKEEDYDEDVEESLLEEGDEDVYILSKVSDITHALFGTYKNQLLQPYFDKLLPAFVKLLGTDRPWADRQWSLCIFDDLIEHGGSAAFNYQSYFLENMVRCVCDKQPEVRQAAAYGIGVMAMYGGQDFVPTLKGVLPSLLQVIQDPQSREPENANPTENAISALTKICRYTPDAVNLEEILPFWLMCLPVWEDEDEAVHIYNYFCDLIQGNHPLITNHEQIPRIVAIISEAFNKEAIGTDSEVGKRMIGVVQLIQQNSEVFQHCISGLNEEQQLALSKALQAQ